MQLTKRNTEELERARADVGDAIMKLSNVRDMLRLIERGAPQHFDDQAMAMFARTTLCEAGGQIERAAMALGIIEELEPEHGCFPGASHDG